jgi:hypothetical protein
MIILKNITFLEQTMYEQLLHNSHKRSFPMYVHPNFPIKANTLTPTFQYHFINEINKLQKEIFPYNEIKHLPISPGGELTVLSLVLSAFLNIANFIHKETSNNNFVVQNEQFLLTFHRK